MKEKIDLFLKDLSKIVDDGTHVEYIETPKGWKCERKGCHVDWMHTHATYPSLSDKKEG